MEDHGGVSRRNMLKRIAVAGGVAWATPVITSLATPAAAAGTPPPTSSTTPTTGASTTTSSSTTQPPQRCGCVPGPGRSQTVVHCGEVPGCACFTLDTGERVCIPGRVACGQPCPCGPDEVCVVDTCCHNGQATCVPKARIENGQAVCAGEPWGQESVLAPGGVPTLAGAAHEQQS